jgi:hypothetical protein
MDPTAVAFGPSSPVGALHGEDWDKAMVTAERETKIWRYCGGNSLNWQDN